MAELDPSVTYGSHPKGIVEFAVYLEALEVSELPRGARLLSEYLEVMLDRFRVRVNMDHHLGRLVLTYVDLECVQPGLALFGQLADLLGERPICRGLSGMDTRHGLDDETVRPL